MATWLKAKVCNPPVLRRANTIDKRVTMYVVYVLRSLKDQKRYIGMTSDIDRRILEHSDGSVK